MNKKISNLKSFLSYDIWRVTEGEVNKTRFSLYNIIKTIFLCVDRFNRDRVMNKASALTYSTLLAIVPMLAILFAIARGFGLDNLVEHQLRNGFGGHTETAEVLISFTNSYLSQTKSGVFIGVGLLMLLYTVIMLTSNIEITFNRIWQVQKQRTLYRKVTDYFSMFLLLPILLVLSGGLSIFSSTILKQMTDYVILAPILKFLVSLSPYVLTWFMFTGLYIFMPNTHVRFKNAFISGVLAGSAYQAFQFLYIGSQIYVSRYNAIYGSFAALPLFLLWVQISWTICLFGAELTYAGQNIKNFSFDKDTRNITRRYRDFVCILILSIIAKRFEKNEEPYSAEEISETHHIPMRLTGQILYLLQQIKLIHEVATDCKGEVVAYQPSVDISKLSVGLLLERMDTYGSEDFKVDKEDTFNGQWQILNDSRKNYYDKMKEVLVKDL